jgi:spoIIIJ-associated protein
MESEEYKNKIISTAKNLLDKIGFDGEVKFIDGNTEEGKLSVISIESENDLSMLIGKSGQNLGAFEHLVKLLAFRQNNAEEKFDCNFIVDINDYRKAKAGYLIELARETARRVIQTQKAEALLPMSSYERKVVHTELASFKEVETESIGQDPRRRIVVKPQLD